MKKIKKIMLLFAVVLAVTGCNAGKEDGKGPESQNNVEKVLEERMAESEADEMNITEERKKAAEDKPTETEAATEENSIDYDLPAMGRRMVYATVNQMMINPEEYEGKSIRMQGAYYGVWHEPSQKYYHYCMVQDALECCAQGIEFVWGDGSHVYPDEYPEAETQVIVTGVFETYTEEDGNLYCRLKDATMELAE